MDFYSGYCLCAYGLHLTEMDPRGGAGQWRNFARRVKLSATPPPSLTTQEDLALLRYVICCK